LVTVANEMERDTVSFDHVHAKDRIASLPADGPDLIVASTRDASNFSSSGRGLAPNKWTRLSR
jgi:hypothetical protein